MKFPPAPGPDQVHRLLNVQQAEREYGLTRYAIYAAVQRGQLHAVQVGGKGRVYYPDWELVALSCHYRSLSAAA